MANPMSGGNEPLNMSIRVILWMKETISQCASCMKRPSVPRPESPSLLEALYPPFLALRCTCQDPEPHIEAQLLSRTSILTYPGRSWPTAASASRVLSPRSASPAATIASQRTSFRRRRSCVEALPVHFPPQLHLEFEDASSRPQSAPPPWHR